MNKKEPLGRGLSALIETDAVAEVVDIETDKIVPNPYQPRKQFDEEKLNELVKSIKNQGIIQPIIVTKNKEKNVYTIVVGERRWRAAKIAGLKTIPAIVKDMSDKQIIEAALIENIQREELNPIELALAYKKLMEEFKYTQEELSEIVSKSRSSVANTLRLLKLPEEIQEAIKTNKITEGHGRALLAIEDDKKRMELFRRMLNEKVTVREAEKKVKQKKQKDVAITDLENRLSSIFQTKVSITGRKKKGTIMIEYYSREQLEGLINMLLGVKND
jgi:ParB family chromosome partitioning protein